MTMTSISRAVRRIACAVAAVILAASPAGAAVYTFEGQSGNTGGGFGDPFSFGVLPVGGSTFSVQDDDVILNPMSGSHSGNNLFTFALTSAATVAFTLSPGLHTALSFTDLNYSRFDNPLYNGCCVIISASNADPSSSLVVSAQLAAGTYEMGVVYQIPKAPLGSPPFGFEAYSGSLEVTSAVPEPATWALMCLGFVGVAVVARRSRITGAAAAAA